MVYNKNKYSSEDLFRNKECIFVKFVSGKFKFIIGFIYTPPTSNFDSFLSTLSFQIDRISSRFSDLPIYLGGDFNSRMENLNQLFNEIILNNRYISEERCTLDSKSDRRGEELLFLLENNGFILVNGRSRSDCPANYTFLNKILR